MKAVPKTADPMWPFEGFWIKEKYWPALQFMVAQIYQELVPLSFHFEKAIHTMAHKHDSKGRKSKSLYTGSG